MKTNEFLSWEKLLEVVVDSGADVVVIGGAALIFQGGGHTTEDIDFAYKRTLENARKLATALADLDPRPVDFPNGVPFLWDASVLMNMTVLTLQTKLGRIDFLAEPEGAPSYETLKKNADTLEFGQRELAVASLEDLLAMKRAAGREKDFMHAREIESLLAEIQRDERGT